MGLNMKVCSVFENGCFAIAVNVCKSLQLSWYVEKRNTADSWQKYALLIFNSILVFIALFRKPCFLIRKHPGFPRTDITMVCSLFPHEFWT